MQKWLIFLFICLAASAKAQHTLDFKTVDSLSLHYYNTSQWDSLIAIAGKGLDAGYDYHYLNLRLGLAWYNKGAMRRAEKYLLKAYMQNSGSDVTVQYLHDAALSNGNFFLAASLQDDITGRPSLTKPVTTVNIEGGSAFSGNTDAAGNVNFISLAAGHLPARKIALYQSYTYVTQQNNSWGDYKQHQYYLAASFPVKHKWLIDASVHAYRYSAVVDWGYDSTYMATKPPAFPGDYRVDTTKNINTKVGGDYTQNGAVIMTGFGRRSGPFNWRFFIMLNCESWTSNILLKRQEDITVQKLKPYMMPIVERSSKDTSYSVGLPPASGISPLAGGTVSYVFPFARELMETGIDIYKPAGRYRPVLSPFINFRFAQQKLHLSYFRKGSFVVAENYGALLNNTYDIIHHRVQFNYSFPLHTHIMMSLNYQYEDKTDIYSLYRYRTNMVSAALKIIL